MKIIDLFPPRRTPASPQSKTQLVTIGAKRPSRWRAALASVAVVALVVLAAMSVARVFHPPAPSIEYVQPEQTRTPDVASSVAVAQSVARAFVNLDDEANRDARLALNWDSPTNTWGGQGNLSTQGNAYTVGARILSETRVDVTVATYVLTSSGAGNWVGVLVPMMEENGRASVAGAPKIVGIPAPVSAPVETLPEADRELTQTTRVDVEAFFTAWASGDATALIAPGATIATPPAGIVTATLNAWTMHAGDGQSRTGTATVALDFSGTTLTCTYTVTLAEIRGETGSRWQVSDLT